MTALRIVVLFLLAAIAEIGGAWLIWQTIRESKPWWFAGLGVLALAGYGFVAAFQPDANFGRVLAAYGGIFVAGSLAWGVFIDGFKPTVWDFIGSTICLIGAAIIMAAPAASAPTE
ncbi:YnfA family protein [Cryobacterium sp. Y29]|uniref:YnfA family protein n=1 Tax=Cryobacterium sp. Y29 TaxID=2048285 RepID=UPI000CE43930|nr:YnfA family protein [Cryobacterium sp. Y29]